jgi:hypothetical protein
VIAQTREDLLVTLQVTHPLPVVAADELVPIAASDAAGATAAAGAAAAADAAGDADVAADGTVVAAAGCPEIHVSGPLAARIGALMVVMVVVVVMV